MADTSRHLDLPRGFHDCDPGRTALYQAIRHDWFTACALAGYQPVEVPPVGFRDTFTRGHHAAGNRLYPFADRSGRDLALVSDSLPAVLRLAHTRKLRTQRLSYCCPVFRYVRRPLRFFHHLGLMEVTASAGALAAQYRSTERLARIVATFLTARLPVRLTVGDPGLWRELIDESAPTEQPELLDRLRRHPPAERPALLHATGCPPAAVRLAELLAEDASLRSEHAARVLTACPPHMRDRVARAHHLAEVIRQHDAASEVDLGCLHASEFHDGPSFQIRPERGRLLGDGGTYGAFATAFLGTATSVHSAIIGLERLAGLEDREAAISPADIAVIAHDDAASIAHADVLTDRLRGVRIRVWDVVQIDRLDKHLRDAAAANIPFVVIIGHRELRSENYLVRDSTGALHTVIQRGLATWLAERVLPFNLDGIPRSTTGNPRRTS